MAKTIVPNDQVPKLYEMSKGAYINGSSIGQAVDAFMENSAMNRNTVLAYFYNFKCLLQSKIYYRLLNTFSIEYYLEHIFLDFGVKGLRSALQAFSAHMDYYEKQSGSNMNGQRAIYDKYESLLAPTLIQDLPELAANTFRLEQALTNDLPRIQATAFKLLEKGVNFVSYERGGEWRFAPSRYCGYMNVDLERYSIEGKNGGRSTSRISSLLGKEPLEDPFLENAFHALCDELGIPFSATGSFGHVRKFWKLPGSLFSADLSDTTSFLEGKLKERIHKQRERNPAVIALAKKTAKNLYGRLLCEACQFDFEAIYGSIGKDFIECHHTIPVHNMKPGHQTFIEDIALLCSNCHRMAHRSERWLSRQELSALVKSSSK